MSALWRKLRMVLHVLAKLIAFGGFGVGSLVYAGFIFPAIQIFHRHDEKARRAMRRSIRTVYTFFVDLMKTLRLITVDVSNPEQLKDATRLVICANHPTLIDVVILFSLVPQADCVVKASLWRNIFMKGIVRQLYIDNSLDAGHLLAAARRSLDAGNNLIIFPEGTRSSSRKDVRLRRSAAQIAVRTDTPILPVRIVAETPVGLRKGDTLFSSPASGIVRFHIHPKPLLHPAGYSHRETPLAARILTNELKAIIIPKPQ